MYMYLCDHGRVGAVLRMERGRVYMHISSRLRRMCAYLRGGTALSVVWVLGGTASYRTWACVCLCMCTGVHVGIASYVC